MYLDLYM